jgi:UDP-N-acetylmuramate: L-alanyl-gamma-D-glutamyl-meso-diaminopimelate ligase
MRRKIFQDVLPEALAIADEIVIGPVSRAQLLEEVERLSPESIAEALVKRGRPAKAFDSAAAIADYLASHAQSGDMVMVMSNGSFDGLSGKLLEKLKSLEGARR